MFLERLSEIGDRIGDVRALSLVAADGIFVESMSTGDDLDLEALAAELMSQVQTIGENHRDLDLGEVRQFSVSTGEMTLMVSSVSDNYYLLLVPS